MPRSDVTAAAGSVAPYPLFPSLACSNWNVKRLTRRFVSWLHLELCDLLDALREWSRKWRVALETKLTNGHLSCRLLLLLLLLLWLMKGMHKICDSCRHKYSSALSANALKVSPTGDNLFTTNHSRVWPSALVSLI